MNLRSINLSLSAELTKMFGVNLGMARSVRLTLSASAPPILEVEYLGLAIIEPTTKRYVITDEINTPAE